MTGRGQLLNELEKIVGNCIRLLALIRGEHLDWRPRENMRTLGELANHLAQVPAVDLKIMRGATEEEVVELEEKLNTTDLTGLAPVMTDGVKDLSRFIENLTFDEYENNSGTAFYGRTQTFAQWLMEVISHIYHHRAMLFTYLKLQGYDVNTRTLYE